jgi:hypothetical protein
MNESSIHNIISDMYIKYENEPNIISKLENYIRELPVILKNIKITLEENKIRMNELSLEQEHFIGKFLSKNFYFYHSTTEKFFLYDKLHYRVISEDDILYHILSSITQEKSCLASWKQKTKVQIIKKIKDKSLIKYAPESNTIQFVLNLFYPTFFSSKTEVKYFLTILGDSILKRDTPNIHFIDSKSKHFLRELNSLCYFYIGCNAIQSIKYKYHETHQYSQCRFLKINDNIKNEILLKTIFESAIDIFAVACHYSTRYISSDQYLIHNSNDTELINTVMILKDKTPEDLVDIFIKEYIQTIPRISSNASSPYSSSPISMELASKQLYGITWKNMLYLWRNFLENKELPTIMFHDSLRNILISHYSENFINDEFVGLTSKYLPLVQNFIDFWEKHIIEDDSELEIEEIRILFKNNSRVTTSNITDKQIIDILTYFFPQIEIISEKYIYGVSCNLWDKDLDIKTALQTLPNSNVDIDDKYLHYCAIYSVDNNLLVSKSYFEKIVGTG